MEFRQIHEEIFADIASQDLIPAENFFYIFPPKSCLTTFPRVHFRIENICSMPVGDDEETISEARLVVDIYSTKDVVGISDAITKSVLTSKHITTLIASSPSYDIEDGVFGNSLTFQYTFIQK